MQLVINPQDAFGRGLRYGLNTGVGALNERFQKGLWILRQMQSAIVGAAGRLPLGGRNEQRLAASKRQTVIDPDAAVAKRAAQVHQRPHFGRRKRLFPIIVLQTLAPDPA